MACAVRRPELIALSDEEVPARSAGRGLPVAEAELAVFVLSSTCSQHRDATVLMLRIGNRPSLAVVPIVKW